MKDNKLDRMVQLYPQTSHHSPAKIKGNIKGLKALRGHLSKAIKEYEEREKKISSFMESPYYTPPDGECYEIEIEVEEDEQKFLEGKVPYSDCYARKESWGCEEIEKEEEL